MQRILEAKTKKELLDALKEKIEDMYFFEEISFEEMSDERKDLCIRASKYLIEQDPWEYWISLTPRGIRKDGPLGIKKTQKCVSNK